MGRWWGRGGLGLVRVQGRSSQEDYDLINRVARRTCHRIGLPGLVFLMRFAFVNYSLGQTGDGVPYVGHAHPNGKIRFRRSLWNQYGPRQKMRLIVHEICHVAEMNAYGSISNHGRPFRTLMRQAGWKPIAVDLLEAGKA